MTSGKSYTKTFDWADPLDLKGRLTEEERMISEVAREYAREKLLPRVVSAFAEERFDREIMTDMGELGLLGVTLPEEYGGASASHGAYGLVAREVHGVVPPRVDNHLTPLGRTMIEPIEMLYGWARDHEAELSALGLRARSRRRTA